MTAKTLPWTSPPMTIWIAWFTRGSPHPSLPRKGEGEVLIALKTLPPPLRGRAGVGGIAARISGRAATPYFPSGVPAGWLTTCQVFLAGFQQRHHGVVDVEAALRHPVEIVDAVDPGISS